MDINFLLGAPKCGTTWLSSALSQHPQICTSNPKEPNIIGSHKGTFVRVHKEPEYESYSGFFSGPGVKLDCSAHTLYCDKAPERVYQKYPDAKFIICLRDPVNRIESHWKMILDTKEDRLNGANWENFSDAWADNRLVECSKYGIALQRWLEFFPLERFLLIGTSRMKNKPNGVLKDIENHLEIESFNFDLDLINKTNKKENRRELNLTGYLLKFFISTIPNSAKRRAINWYLRKDVDIYQSSLLSKKRSSEIDLSDSDKRKIVQDLSQDNRLLESLIGFEPSKLDW